MRSIDYFDRGVGIDPDRIAMRDSNRALSFVAGMPGILRATDRRPTHLLPLPDIAAHEGVDWMRISGPCPRDGWSL